MALGAGCLGRQSSAKISAGIANRMAGSVGGAVAFVKILRMFAILFLDVRRCRCFCGSFRAVCGFFQRVVVCR